MKLLADSGATGTDWALLGKNKKVISLFRTKGMNVNYLSEQDIEEIITKDILPHLSNIDCSQISSIHFYGSGCSTATKQSMVKKKLQLISPNAAIFPDHDMLGAAISISGKDMGMVGILGTGSNTCFYDGKIVKKNILSLGYLLGDEGSGTYMGMQLLRQYLKGLFPKDLETIFKDKFHKEKSEIVAEMYAAPKAGAYFASYSYFIVENKNHLYIQNLIKDAFRTYFKEQVLHFEEAKQFPIGFVGSIAYLFENELRSVASEFNMTVGNIIKNPIEGLISYYQKYE